MEKKMLSLTTAASIGSLTGCILGNSDLILANHSNNAIVVYQKNQQQLCYYGFKEVVIITPLIQEIVVRGGVEFLISHCLAGLGITDSLFSIISAASLAFGLLHYCCDREKSALASLKVAFSGVCYSYLKHTCGLSSAVIAHSVNNLIEYRRSKEIWEGAKARSDLELSNKYIELPQNSFQDSFSEKIHEENSNLESFFGHIENENSENEDFDFTSFEFDNERIEKMEKKPEVKKNKVSKETDYHADFFNHNSPSLLLTAN
jgi:Type II CAAX prenyl endopeptidase Rce1-like